MTTTLAGLPALTFALTIPRRGAWSASVVLEGEASLSGDVDLSVEGRVWRGRVRRGANELGRWHGTVVGAGALLDDIDPQSFRAAALAEVFGETLRAAGLAAAADVGALSEIASHWHRVAGPAGRTIAAVADAAGFGWRVRRDGTVWAGPETWAAQAPAGDPIEVMAVDPALGRYELAGNAALDLDPGRTVTLDGAAVRVGLVEHHQAGAALRSVVWTERDGDRGADRLRAALSEIVRREVRALDFAGSYAATVVQQASGGGNLDLRPEDPRRPSCQNVPYRTLPGLVAEIPAGSRVCFTYEDADPRRPVVVLWEPTTSAGRWTLYGGTRRAARIDDTTANGSVTATVAPTVPPPPLPAPPTNDVTLTYTAPGGATSTITLTGLPASVAASGSHALVGKIDSGTDLLRLP